MNIKNRMIGSNLFIVLLFIAIIFFCLKLIHLIEEKYVRVTNETIPMIESIKDLESASLRLVISTSKAIFIDRVSVFIEAD